jgi:hypothetical protein
MPWVRFTANFDWKPKPQVTQAFLAGQERNVTTPCADAAIAKGAAVKIRKEKAKPGES